MEAELQMQIEERRSKSISAIRHLVSCRNDVLSLVAQIASQQPFENADDTREVLLDFCEALIDYTATAHFKLYRFIESKKERRQSVVSLANDIYPRIMMSTQVILDFNDQYDGEKDEWDLTNLASDMSTLGEALADRIEYEDQLIELLTSGR